MATEHNYDPLRNPQVDYEREDLSARGILIFLVGLLLCGVFVEVVLWGMFRFMAKSDVLFPQPTPNPMMSAQKLKPTPVPGSIFENNPGADLKLFPEPRLQVNDAGDMSKFRTMEHKVLYPEQPFTDSTGAVHISISEAMTLVEQRGLPVRPNPPPESAAPQAESGNAGGPQEPSGASAPAAGMQEPAH